MTTELPTNAALAGDYNVLYHSSCGIDDEIENRTTKGLLQLSVGDADDVSPSLPQGRCTFHPDHASDPECGWRHNFTLETNSSGDSASSLVAVLRDAEGNDVTCSDHGAVKMSRVESRWALPWTKDERVDDDEDEVEPGSKVEFDTLEQAEALAQRYADAKPKPATPPPVFFLEPGDLILDIVWDEDFREPNISKYVLRRCTSSKEIP